MAPQDRRLCKSLQFNQLLVHGVEDEHDNPDSATDRAAVLVVADRFVEDNAWNLPSAGASLDLVQQALAQGADIPLRFQRVVRGEQVGRDSVEHAVLSQAKLIRGDGLLVIYWIGHGWIGEDGRALYFTHWTKHEGGNRFSACLTRDDLSGLSYRVRAQARQQGGDLQTVILNDVCRIQVGAPPPTGKLTPLQDWEVYATQAGRFAIIPSQGPTPFATAWSAALVASAKRGVEGDLIAVFGDVRERTVQATNGNQSPELVTPPEAKAPAVVRAARVRVRVRVVDALTRSVVSGATVAIGEGKEVAVDPTTTLVLTPGQVRFTVNGAQCLTTSLDLLARTESSGSVLDLPAYPSLVVITGKLDAPGWPVRLKGVTGRVREDCHRLETRTDNQGSFTLFAPEIEPGLAVSFGGMVHPVPTGPDSWTLREMQPGVMAPTCDLGILSVRPSSNQGIAPVPESVRAPAEAIRPAPVQSVDSITAANPAPPSGDTASATASGSQLDGWPWYRRAAAATGAIPAVVDLQDDGTPAGQVPNRFLVGARTPSLDLSEAGAPSGYLPKRFLVGARTPAMDLSAAGHAPTDTFAEIQSAITRSQREAAQAAAAAANAPAPPAPAIAGRWRITSNAGKDLVFTFDQSGRWTSPWGDFSGTWTFRNGRMTMIANRPVTVTITSPNAMHLSTNIEIDLVRAGP